MKRFFRCVVIGAGAAAIAAGSYALAMAQSSSQDGQPPDDPGFELPPGMSMEDVMAYAEAGTPGPKQAFLVEGAGIWEAETTMWMSADSAPIQSTGRATVTPLMDGRFVQVDMTGEMPGMGEYRGMGIYGYDNVAKHFQCTWIDNHSTGMMIGTGELSEDGTTITWEFVYNCPITKQPAKMREIERFIDKNTKTLEIHGAHGRGEEFKMMEIKFTRPAAGR